MISQLKLNVMLERSSLTHEQRELIRDLVDSGFEVLRVEGEFLNIFDYLTMHQLEPCIEIDVGSIKDINVRLDNVMANDKL